ncbi:MAG: hypothetical protein LIO71_03335 [Ruminococcus sp.]|nr:hypothetical protein [Ruminococcus sp.]
MAKGTQSKEIITQKILEVFPNSFLYNGNKEIRIPMVESGENIQIKINLVCAKENVINGAADAIPGEPVVTSNTATTSAFSETAMNAPTEQEKQNVKDLLAKLGL